MPKQNQSPLSAYFNDLDLALQKSLVAHFEAAVTQFPQNFALRSNGDQYTYAELNQWANRLAHAILQRCGTQPEPVGFVLEDTTAGIATMLGLMKAGKAYVPIDPSLPPGRITQILANISTASLVTNDLNLPRVQALPGAERYQIINLDQLNPSLPNTNPEIEIDPTLMAYMLYTSGSMGTPKGVIHSHRDALYNILLGSQDNATSPQDRLAMLVSMSFEAGRSVIYGALLNGGLLSMYDIRSSGLHGTPDWMEAEGITFLMTTPSTFRHMFDLTEPKRVFKHVRLVNLGGEAVGLKEIDIFEQRFSADCLLKNTLGLTETGNLVRYDYRRGVPLSGATLPSGTPMGDKTLLLVDDAGQPVPAGAPGEIWVRSRYLSPGYWKSPELTAERYKADPDDPNLRTFRTGDLGRLLPDGNLEYLGRKDAQVKIRGFAVDIAEVEATINAHPEVKDAAIAARQSKNGDVELVAYVVPRPEVQLTPGTLRNAILERLPAYSMPALILFVEALPLTPTGKVDHLALPAPESVMQQRKVAAPRDEMENTLVKNWEMALKSHPIGVEDNFFELGGNSILAAQIYARIEKIYKKRIPLASLFEAPTITTQAELLRQKDWNPVWQSLVPLRRGEPEMPPLIFAAPVGGNVLSYHDLINLLPADWPCYGLQAIGLDGVQASPQSIGEIAVQYIQELQQVQPHGPYYLCGSSFGGLVAYEMAQRLHDLGEPVALVAMFDAYGPNYPRRLPGNNRLRRRIYKLLRRIDTHLENLKVLDWPGKAWYFQTKGQRLWKRAGRILKRNWGKLTRPLPGFYKSIEATQLKVHKRRTRGMREMRRFGGRLVLFRAEKQPLGIYPDPTLGWKTVVGEEIEVYPIPGHHTSIIYEPRVAELAKIFRQIVIETLR